MVPLVPPAMEPVPMEPPVPVPPVSEPLVPIEPPGFPGPMEVPLVPGVLPGGFCVGEVVAFGSIVGCVGPEPACPWTG